MDKDKRDRMRQAQLRDVDEMQAIFDKTAAGVPAAQACAEVTGRQGFELSQGVAESIERGPGEHGKRIDAVS